MKHIRQINSVGTDSYTVVITDDWDAPLNEHPCIIDHPDLFEISEDEIPTIHQYLKYHN